MKKYTIILLAGALAVWGTAMTIHYARADGPGPDDKIIVARDKDMKTIPGKLWETFTVAWDVTSMNKQVDATSFVVNQNCSGTKIGDELILTANHCINDMFEDVERDVVNDDGQVEKKKFRIAIPGYVSQKFFDGVHETRTYSYRYKIKARDIKLDLAILKTDTPLPPSEKSAISCKEPVRGDTVYAVGNPFVVLYATVTKGTVASVQRNYEQLGVTNGSGTYGQDNGLIQFTAPIAPGNSGGALYNDAGELIGVVVRGGNYTLGLGVPLSDVREFLKDNDAFVAYGVKKVCD